MALLLTACSTEPTRERRIAKDEYQDKVAASWLGQIVGNIYGLSYEFKFLEEPGPDEFPYGFGETLDLVRELDGAFSDDDTDIEYMSLIQMENHGPEPTYRVLSEAWKYHIRERIWAANRVALTLMHHGYWPPATGSRQLNERWFEIDPQLVNEIWAVTAPGMVDYSVAKTEWVSHITNDSFGLEPAMFYAAMYSEAFFSSDVHHLIEVGQAALSTDSYFGAVISEMIGLYELYPSDWQSARRELKDRYFVRQPYNTHGWEPIDATLNGGAAVLALLYGDGDIWRTLDFASAMGFDADNQAATLTGLLALSKGTEALPRELLYPVESASWSKPFNDRYINITRHDLPDASISDLINRLAAQGEAVILANGGRIESGPLGDEYVVETNASFEPPFELLPTAPVLVTVGDSVRVSLYGAGGGFPVTWSWEGDIPPGMEFEDGVLSGIAAEKGEFHLRITLSNGQRVESIEMAVFVRSQNLAPSAISILHNQVESDLEMLRDGLMRDPAFHSETRSEPFIQWYGYEFADPISISRLGLQVGWPQEEWGWLKDPEVEYLDSAGTWQAVSQLRIQPPFPVGTSKYLQPGFVQYDFRFDPVLARSIRIVAMAGGHPVDAPPTFGSIVSELSIHKQ